MFEDEAFHELKFAAFAWGHSKVIVEPKPGWTES